MFEHNLKPFSSKDKNATHFSTAKVRVTRARLKKIMVMETDRPKILEKWSKSEKELESRNTQKGGING